MDSVLVIITTISLVLAVAMGIIVFRVLRDESQRVEARVALLSAAARDDDPLPLQDPDDAVRLVAPDPPSTAAGSLFSVPENDSPWLRRVGAAVVLAGVVAAAGYAGMKNAGPSAPRAAVQTPPLELLALRHAPQPDALIVSGTVRNPRGGATVSNVIVTAALFSADGSLLASARAPLDFPTLAPGDESPFVVTIPVKGAVARYRVGFRSPDGSVMAHVDRRADLVSAQTAGVGGSTP
jgi:hypothetical protein